MSPTDTQSKITYWYHPESESLFIHDPDNGEPIEKAVDELCVELDEYEYVKKVIEAIDADPDHALPEGITGVIKLGYTWPGKRISGMLWYDKFGRFPNDYPINTSDIESKEPGGIYCTKNNKYIVEIIQPMKDVV